MNNVRASIFLLVLGAFSSSFALAGRLQNFEMPRVKGLAIVHLQPEMSRNAHAVSGLAKRYGLKLEHLFQSSSAVLLRTIDQRGGDLGNWRKLAADPNVRLIEANTLVRAVQNTDAVIPNDPRFAEQYALANTGQTGGKAGADIRATEAWSVTTGDRRVIVAVIDTGITYGHADLASNIYQNPGETGVDANGKDKRSNGVDDDANGFVDDFQGWDFAANDNNANDDNGYSHGTHCAGVIGAKGNDGFGMAGINWQVSLLPIKFLAANGGGTLADAIKSVEYATLMGAHIQSNSWGGGGYSEALYSAIVKAGQRGSIFVAAAGNDGENADRSPHYPSSYKNWNMLSVAAVDHNDALAKFSNYGAQSVHVAAPGVDILSAVKSGGFEKLSGTSMATPQVAGALALIMAAHPNLAPRAVMDRVTHSIDPIESLRKVTKFGGRINVVTSIENDTVAPESVGGVVIESVARQTMLIQWRASGDDGEVGLSRIYEVRSSANPIVSEDDWRQALPVALKNLTEGAMSRGELLRFEGSGFRFNETGYFAVRAVDNVGNMSALNESIRFAMQQVEIVGAFSPEAGEGLSLGNGWGTQNVGGRRQDVFTESPSGLYPRNFESALLLPEMVGALQRPLLSFETAADLERGYDFVFVEVKKDNGSWTSVKRLTDIYDWKNVQIDLSQHVAGATKFQIRFRFKSDGEYEQDGIWLDDIVLIQDAAN
jgi:hypothetical protein